MKQHRYEVRLDWIGNDGEGTRTYKSYRRDHKITCDRKAPIEGSSDPSFRGDPSRYNPEELLVASLASCHMLWYLHLCAINKVVVVEYNDAPVGTMIENGDGSGRFAQVTLNPTVKIENGFCVERAGALHDEAHRNCFIANSVNFPVRLEPEIVVAAVRVPS
jgi:organic hydroperoxide reductase OsmC/OhrA